MLLVKFSLLHHNMSKICSWMDVILNKIQASSRFPWPSGALVFAWIAYVITLSTVLGSLWARTTLCQSLYLCQHQHRGSCKNPAPDKFNLTLMLQLSSQLQVWKIGGLRSWRRVCMGKKLKEGWVTQPMLTLTNEEQDTGRRTVESFRNSIRTFSGHVRNLAAGLLVGFWPAW